MISAEPVTKPFIEVNGNIATWNKQESSWLTQSQNTSGKQVNSSLQWFWYFELPIQSPIPKEAFLLASSLPSSAAMHAYYQSVLVSVHPCQSRMMLRSDQSKSNCKVRYHVSAIQTWKRMKADRSRIASRSHGQLSQAFLMHTSRGLGQNEIRMCDAHNFWSSCGNAHLGVGFYAFLATLNSKSALFVATKWDGRAQHEPAAVDPDCAYLEGAWHIICSVQVIGENTSCQAVHTVVGTLYYLLNDNISLWCWAFICTQAKAWFCLHRESAEHRFLAGTVDSTL